MPVTMNVTNVTQPSVKERSDVFAIYKSSIFGFLFGCLSKNVLNTLLFSKNFCLYSACRFQNGSNGLFHLLGFTDLHCVGDFVCLVCAEMR